MALSDGEVLQQRYHIRQVLKSGGMGSVYLAHDANLDGPCAVKEMHPTDDSWVSRRFREEATLLSQLQHNNIPRVRDFFQLARPTGTLCYIVMDYVKGVTLHHELEVALKEGHKGLDSTRVRQIALSMLGVLEYLHARTPPIIHRDIKPANIIREEGTERLFLVDFGLARGTSEHTQTTAGTLMFCPPEQMLGKADCRSDLYALGATLYLLLTGQPIQIGRSLPVMALRPDLEPRLAETIDTALQLDPDQRFASAQAMRDFLSGTQVIVKKPSKPVPVRVWAGAAAVVAGLAVSGYAWTYKLPGPSPSSTPVVEVSPPFSPTPIATLEPTVAVPSLPPAPIQLSTVSVRPTWYVRERLTPAQLSQAYLRLWSEVNTYATSHGEKGVIYVRYYTAGPEEYDMELGMTLSSRRPGQGRIQAGQLPGGRVAMLTHIGDYPQLQQRFVELDGWIQSHGLKAEPGPYALYVVSYDSGKKPEEFRTEVFCPLAPQPVQGRPAHP